MTREEFEILDSWVYTKIKMKRDYYSRAKIIEMIMERVETLVKPNDLLHDVIQSDFFCHRECSDGIKCDKQCLLCADMEKHSV